MDGFDDDPFGAGAPPPMEDVDPAAEFLAKEQAELGDMGEDFGIPAAVVTAPTFSDDTPAFNEELNVQENQQDFMAEFEEPSVPVATNQQDFMAEFEEPSVPVATNYSAIEDQFGGGYEDNMMTTGMSGMRLSGEEPECLKLWKREQEMMLKKKDADEEVKKEELRMKAKQELEDWYQHYEEQLSKSKMSNREKEEEFVAEIGGMNHIEPGSEWERVAKHCDFSAKAAGHTKDVSRMRSILLQLKQNPPAAIKTSE